jgi:exopolysaccharide/PEP-CTERM locus tyrosine autokinase
VSRIEQALEKAAKLREMATEVLPEATAPTPVRIAPHVFDASETSLDTAKVDRHVVSITDPHSAAAEQYKRLKARILSATAKSLQNVIMITSTDASEGKSLTAVNLAAALANEIDYTVLLVDADLRNPTVHKYLGIDQKRGLTEYLQGKVKLSEVLVKTGIGRLVVLPAGEPPENASELLSSERMKRLMKELKLRYEDRYIILDTSPLLVTADPLALGSAVDGVLLVLQEGRTSQKAAKQAVSLMKGWNVLGVVFNNVSEYLSKNKYAYYYRYGKKTEQNKSGKIGGSFGNE